MEDKFVIFGGIPLKGEVEVMGAKNAAFPILAASLLTDETCTIDNIPKIEDVFKMIEILNLMGAQTAWKGERKLQINCGKVDPKKISGDLVKHFRGSVLLLGALLVRCSEISIPAPGGCVIGSRPIDTHLDAFRSLGVKVETEKKTYHLKRRKDNSDREVILNEISVTATENVLLFSAGSSGKTVIKLADLDYQTQDLLKVLAKMGAKIKYGKIREIEITGRSKLKGFNHKLIYDPIEAGTFIIAALATKGTVTVKNAELEYMELFLKRLKDFGAKLKILNKKTIKVMPSTLVIDKIQSLPYPGIHSDLQPVLGVLATQTKGPTMIHDPLFEGRLRYLNELNKMGADIMHCDPHRAVVSGPTKLQGVKTLSLDLRAGAAVIVAGLIAQGETIISDIYQIDRGYEKIEERLVKLGANIKRKSHV